MIGITAWLLVLLALTIGVVAFLAGDVSDRYVKYAFFAGLLGAIGMAWVELRELRPSVRRTLRVYDITGPRGKLLRRSFLVAWLCRLRFMAAS